MLTLPSQPLKHWGTKVLRIACFLLSLPLKGFAVHSFMAHQGSFSPYQP